LYLNTFTKEAIGLNIAPIVGSTRWNAPPILRFPLKKHGVTASADQPDQARSFSESDPARCFLEREIDLS
jgi:hypothetical protein